MATSIFTRYPANPILTTADWPVPVNSVFNPGACRVGDDTVLVCRVEDATGISHLWAARSPNGVSEWHVDPEPLLSPRAHVESEQWGLEDPRVVRIDELGCWAITCTAYGPPGPAVFLATTDFNSETQRHGMITPPEDKNAALFPRRIDGDWVLIHRPVAFRRGPRAEIWLSRSRDLDSWRRPELVVHVREGAYWDSTRIGIGPPPIETEHGWLLLYHGVKDTANGCIYRVGAALLDLDDPTKVVHRTPAWLLAPQAEYERVGDVPNVVFPCGATYDPATDVLNLYYGAADTTVALATASLSALVDHLRASTNTLDLADHKRR